MAGTVERHLRDRGASQVEVVQRTFMFEGASQAVTQVARQAGCIGFLVIGGGEVRDVDVTLYTAGGLPLDEDVSAAPYGYVRACTEAYVSIVIGTTLYAGRGELTLLRVENAPRELGRLPESLALSVVPGGRSEEPEPIGTPADEEGISTLLASEEAALFDRGYVALGAPEVMELSGGEAEAPLPLSAGQCVRLVAHAPGVRGLTLQIEGGAGDRALARAPNRDSIELAFCPSETGVHRLRARARAMRAMLVFRVFEHPESPTDESDAELALGVAEVRHQWKQRGLSMLPLGDAWVEPREPARFEVQLERGQCYGLAAVSAEGSVLDLRLTDPLGHLLSRTEGRSGVPVLYACPSESGRHTLLLTSRGREQRASAWLSQVNGKGGPAP